MKTKTWYVEVTKTTKRFGYVRAATRREALALATDYDGDRDGLTTQVGDWQTEIISEYEAKQDTETGALEIL